MVFRIFFSSLLLLLCINSSGQYLHDPYQYFTLRDGLSQMQVVSMFQDSRGAIWIGTKGGINCFNGDKIIKYTAKDGLYDDYIADIDEDSEGRIWMASGKGLACFDGEKIMVFPHDDIWYPVIEPGSDGRIWYFRTSDEGKNYFGYLLDGKYHPLEQEFPELQGSRFPGLAFCAENDALLIKNKNCVYELKEGKLTELMCTSDSLIIPELYQDRVYFVSLENRENFKLYEYKKGRLAEAARVENNILGKQNQLNGAVHFCLGLNDSISIQVNPDTLIIKTHPNIQKNLYFIDRENKLWIGSEEGFCQIQESGFETYKSEYLPQVWAVTEDLRGNMWFASHNFGLKMFDGKTFRSFPELAKKKLASYFYFQPSLDKMGRLFFPNGYGLLVYDGKEFTKIKNSKTSLTSFYDSDRELIWSGIQKGVEIYDRKLEIIRKIGEAEGIEIRNYVITIDKDIRGEYWFGSFSGLSRYNWESGQIVNYNLKNKRLPAEGVISVFNDFYGTTWFGSTNGLLKYNAENDSVIKFENDQLSEAVSFVTAIDSSWLIVSQPNGIYLFDLKEYYKTGVTELHFFNEKNGFLGIEPGQDGAFTDSKGNIWMTTGTEVVKLNPGLINLQNNKLYARINGLNGIKLRFNQKSATLPKNEKSAIVTFDAICFNRPREIEYSWKIKGNKTQWSDWQKENYAVIASLPGGNSTVQLRARIPGFQVSDDAMDELTLNVSLAIWKQAWFFPSLFGFFAFVSLLTLLLLAKVYVKMSKTRRQAKAFQIQAIQSQMNPHFIFNVLASFQSMILSTSIEKANEYLVKLAVLIRGFLDSSTAITIARNYQNMQTLKKELDLLNSFVSFQQLIYPGKFEYFADVDPVIDTEKVAIPPMLLQPFIENSIRHGLLLKTGKGILRLSITRYNKNGLRIKISDDGIGMEKAAQTINESPFRYDSKGSTLTLQRIKLLNELGYPISVQTTSSDQGTTIEIKILNHEQ